MCLPVGTVFELICEVATAWATGIGGVSGCEGACVVDVVIGGDYGGRGDEGDLSAEGGEERGFLGGGVGGEDAGEIRGVSEGLKTEGVGNGRGDRTYGPGSRGRGRGWREKSRSSLRCPRR